MGGNYKGIGNSDTRTAEYNFYTDVESAHLVLHTLKCPKFMLVWEAAIPDNLPLETVSFANNL